MNATVKAPKGTQDLLPSESGRTQFVEGLLLDVARQYGFKEIRTPVFEDTALFQRSVGDTTDVVQKEMYTFTDKGGRSVTLRPEGTAGVARAVLEHSLHNDALPVKVCYLTSCYRYEKPQAGRLREFHQFGLETFGAASPCADAEIIACAHEVFERLGVKDVRLEINSIGCPTCRKAYHEALHTYFAEHREALCETCGGRLERNPMRILDCKSPVCSEIAKGAPRILDFLCDDCRAHFDAVQQLLTETGIEFTVNPSIVRGLDYYTRTVFEFVSGSIGAQATVCGGGRYDGLIEELGGPHLPSLGFGMGIERLMLVLRNQGVELPEDSPCMLYVAPMGDAARLRAFAITQELRAEGFAVQTDLVGRSLKAQMKYADKIGAVMTLVLGDNEIASGKAVLKNMATGEQTETSLKHICDALYHVQLEQGLSDISAAGDAPDLSAMFGALMGGRDSEED